MEPYYIDLGLDKFQICVCHGCPADASRELSAELRNGVIFYLGVCESEEHFNQVVKIKKRLAKGDTPGDLDKNKLLDLDDLFICPPGKDQKCKVAQWEAFKADPHAKPKMPQPPKMAKQNSFKACKEWEWVHRFDRWMTIEGKEVRLERLPLAQFISAALAIQKTNFSRITTKTKWVRMLVKPEIVYTYPEEQLLVGHHEAGLKLGEFKDEAEERGLL